MAWCCTMEVLACPRVDEELEEVLVSCVTLTQHLSDSPVSIS